MTDSGGYLSHHGSLRHSHSTPLTPGSSSGVGMVGSDPARTPPATPKKGGKILAVRVQMLDDSITMFQVQAKALGRLLFDQVCRQLNLLEADYFGLEYTDLTSGARYWLDLEKPLGRQVGLSLCDALLRFCTKFYTPDPAHLEEEFTRYLLCLQVKRDLAQGLLQCNDNTAALMASYIVQSECGDYVVEDYPDHTYLSSYKFVPHQDSELERRIMENHKKHAGQSPAEADLNLLETARRCELYGVKMHPAKDNEGVPLNLAVAHMGIVVFQNYTKINTFSWAKIRKLSFKRKRFLIKLHPEGYGYYKDTVEFFFEGRNECKNFWKKCVEHHGFFRCSSVKMIPRHKARVISRGSSFRYSGRTQKQIVEFVRENYVKRQTFQRSGVVLPRSQSFRHSRCVHSSVASVGTSISAHPLLPLGDNAVAGTPASLSCGSVTLEDPGSPGGRYPGSAPCTSPAHTMEHHHHHHTHHSHQGLSGIGRPTSRQDTLSPATSVASSPSPPPAVTTDTSVGTFGIRDNTPPPPYSGPMVSSLPPPSPRPVVTAVPLESPKNNVNSKSDIQQTVVNNSIILPTPISNNNNNNNAIPVPIEVDVRRKRFPTDRAYFMAKELLMTERTYKKDLEVIDVWLREEVGKEESCSELEPLNSLINLVSPLLQFHTVLLREVDQRLATWEGRSNAHLKGNYQRIGDVLLRNMTLLPLYESYIAHHRVVLEALDLALRQSRRLMTLHRDFEAQKVCYLPLSALSLKPLHRLLHYDRLLDRLTNHYGPQHPDYADCMEAKQKLSTLVQRLPAELRASEGWAQLSELRRHVAGCGEVLAGRQQFLRQGCLMKLSRKGFQQRLFLLFSDVLLYCSRCVPTNGNSLVGSQQEFKVHGQLPLRGLLVEDSEERQGAQFCITLASRGRVTIAAASSAEERERWVQAIITAIKDAENSGSFSPVLSACSSSDEVLPGSEEMPSPQTPQKAVTSTQRSNTSVHVCWHRGASLGLDDQLRAVENQLSGFLLRKFKNSNGWQKLWVVFTNFCLFFYKTFQDDAPLASLPLLGYSVSCPEDKDAIAKDYVFKLQFKTHVYFFRAESEYTFGRWMEVISSATLNQMPIQPNVN